MKWKLNIFQDLIFYDAPLEPTHVKQLNTIPEGGIKLTEFPPLASSDYSLLNFGI